MHPVAYVLTQKITQKIHETAAKQAEQSRASQVDDGIARPYPFMAGSFGGVSLSARFLVAQPALRVSPQ